MGNNTISQKIDAYAQANLKALKQEEAKTGRKMTKFDIAQYMLQHGKLNKNEYANWMNTTEGFNAQAMTQQQKTALKQGSVWGFAGYGGGQESYLDSMTSFSQKTPVEKQNAISGHQMKLNETVAERKKKAAEMQKEIKQQQVTNQILNPNQALKEQKFKDHISSLPEVDATYTELMNDIKFQNMDKKQKTEFLLKTTGQKFYEAKERGDKEAMKEYLKQGIGLTFAYMDDKAGITDIKEAVKKYSGLNTVVDAIDKLVDDGDNSNLSLGEKTWETIKGAGDAVDGFIGTQGAAFVGTLAVASEAAAAAGIGKAFALVTQAYFAYEGGTMVVDGAVDVANAQTKEEARVGGQELGTGAIMLGGTAKSAKQGYRNIKIKQSDAHATKSETPSADFASKLADTKIPRKKLGVTVKTKLTQEEINNLIENCQHGFITDGKPIPNYEARIEAVLNNPKELAIIAECKNTVAGIWRAIQDPLDSTFEKNPELFADTKVKITPDSNVAKTSIKADIDPDAQLRTKLTEFKGPNGKAFLSKPEVENLIENCQHGFITDGKPIPNYEAKIEAVLNNPEEVASISGLKSRSAGIWRAIQDPLSSTVEANPELFGAKPKAEVKGGNNTAKTNVGNSSIENLKAFFEDPKYECMSDFLKNKDILTNNDVIKTDIITDAYGYKTPVIITKIPLKTESGTIPAGSQLSMNAGTLNFGKNINYSNVKVELNTMLKDGEYGEGITIPLDMSKDKATITQLNYMTDTYGYAGGLYLNAFPDLAAIIAKSAKTTVEASPEAFGAKPKAEVKTDIKTQTKSSSMSPDIRNSLIEDLKNVKYDKQVTIDTMDQYPEFVEELVNFKVDGKQFFSMREVNDIIYNCLSGNDGLKASPERIRKVLNNPSEISFMRDECKSKAVGLWVALFR